MMLQTIKNSKSTSKLKDRTHSEYMHQLMAYKKRITEIQQWIKTEKELISMYMKLDKLDNSNVEIEHKRLKMLKNENKFLSEANKELRKTIKEHQKSMSTLTYKGAPVQQRMYSMVLRQLTPMQKGIQALHSVVEYGEMVKQDNISELAKKTYEAWANRDKTMIVLDAGTSVDLVDVIFKLKELGVPHTVFHEPDLYGCITSVCFVADERVWDTKKYPTYDQYVADYNNKQNELNSTDMGGIKLLNAVYIIPPTKEMWQATTFGTIDPEPYLALRDLIFSKKLSM